jgi:hypothetical protein
MPDPANYVCALFVMIYHEWNRWRGKLQFTGAVLGFPRRARDPDEEQTGILNSSEARRRRPSDAASS